MLKVLLKVSSAELRQASVRSPGARLTEVWLLTISLIYYSSEWRMKSLLTSSLLFISIQFNDIVNNQSLVRRAPAKGELSSAYALFTKWACDHYVVVFTRNHCQLYFSDVTYFSSSVADCGPAF